MTVERLPGSASLGTRRPLRRLTSGLFLAVVLTVTFAKIQWNVAGAVSLADVLAVAFVVAFCATTTRLVVPRTVAPLVAFAAAFLAVYLLGYFNLGDSDSLAQWAKGLSKWIIHFAFLVCAVIWLARRGERYYRRAVGWFCAGFVVNAVYGVAQLVYAQGGGNLDSVLVTPLTGAASQINVYGSIGGSKVYRVNALTLDPNHLGIMLIVPLLLLTPLYLRSSRGTRLRTVTMLAIAFLLVMEIATLSRSGAAGLLVGALILAVPYRHFVVRRALLVPVGAACVVVAVVLLSRPGFFETVLKSRLQTGGRSTNAHFQVYSFVPTVLHTHPLLGLGLNTFSVYYQFVTGKSNWGPHSYFVATIVETGVVGAAVFAWFVLWVFSRLAGARELGRRLTRAGDPRARLVRPLAWGCTAALAGTLAANVFYLTIQFYYFYVFLALALALPLVHSVREERRG